MHGDRVASSLAVVGRAARVWEVPTLPAAVQRLLNPRTTRHSELDIEIDACDVRLLLSGGDVQRMANSEGADAHGDPSDGDDATELERWRSLRLVQSRDASATTAVELPPAERPADEVEREVRLGFAPPIRSSSSAATRTAAATAGAIAAAAHSPPAAHDATLAARTARTIAFVARRVAACGTAERGRRLELALRRRGALNERLAFLRPDSASNGAWRLALAAARKGSRTVGGGQSESEDSDMLMST